MGGVEGVDEDKVLRDEILKNKKFMGVSIQKNRFLGT